MKNSVQLNKKKWTYSFKNTTYQNGFKKKILKSEKL